MLSQVVFKWCVACAQAQINDILHFRGLGGCDEYSIDSIITDEDWDNSTLLDVPRIARIPDTIFLTIHANAYKIAPHEWVLYFLNGGRKLERIEQVGVRRRRQTAGQRLAGEAAALDAAEFDEDEAEFAADQPDSDAGNGHPDSDHPDTDDETRAPPPQRAPAPRGMGSAGTPNGLDPNRAGARESHERHVKQALALQTRLHKNNEEERCPARPASLTLPPTPLPPLPSPP